MEHCGVTTHFLKGQEFIYLHTIHTLIHLLDYVLPLFIAVRRTWTSPAVGISYIFTENLPLLNWLHTISKNRGFD